MENQQRKSIEVRLKNRFNDDYKGIFHFFKTEWRKILILIFCAMVYAFGQTQFILQVAIVSDGIEAVSGTLSFLIPILKPYITVLYLACNIPLILIYWKKIKKTFMVTTLIFLIFNALFGFVFTLEPIDNFFSEKLIVFVEKGWEIAQGTNGITNNVNLGWPVIVYSILATAFCSPPSAVVWKMGSSTGGTDIIAYYFSSKLKKPIGNVLVVIGGIMSIFGIVTLFLCKEYAPTNIANGINGYKNFLSPQFFASGVYITLNAIIINAMYPKYQKVKMRIDTRYPDDVQEFFNNINFWHPYQIKKSTSGYTKDNIFSIESIVLLLESDELALKIKRVAPDAWISITPISKIYGRFDYSKID